MKTNKECLDQILQVLKNKKVKDIEVNEESGTYVLVTFSVKGISYSIFIEDEQTVHYSVLGIKEDENMFDETFSEANTEYRGLNYIDDFIANIEDGDFNYIKEVWYSIEKLKDKHGYDQVKELVKQYFALYD